MISDIAHGQCWFTLDRDWVIASCGDDVPGVVTHSVGMNVWEAFPGTEAVFRGVYEEGWENGHAAGVFHWNGQICDLRIHRRNDSLFIDVARVTITGLRATLARISEEGARPGSVGSPPAQPRHLRLVADAR